MRRQCNKNNNKLINKESSMSKNKPYPLDSSEVAILNCVINGTNEELEKLLSTKPKLNFTDGLLSPLHHAVMKGLLIKLHFFYNMEQM